MNLQEIIQYEQADHEARIMRQASLHWMIELVIAAKFNK